MASAEAVAAVAPPVAQTVVLRVSIHCMGCKKKVRKVLRSIEGVHDVKVDAAMQKVTVTGTVDGDTLVRRLYKSGKNAVPWQHPHKAPLAAPAPAKKAEAAPQPEAPAPAPAGDAAADKKTEDQPQPVKGAGPAAESSEMKPAEQTAESKKEPEAEKGAEPEKKEEAKPSDEATKDAGESEAAEPKAKNGERAEPVKEVVPVPAAPKQAGNNDEDEAKKEKGSPKEASDAVLVPAAAATTEKSLFPPAPAHKHAQEEHYPYSYYTAPQPVLSYHMAQPSPSLSYYAPRPEPAYSVQQQQQPAPPLSPPQPMQQQWSPSYLYMPYPHSAPEPYYHDYYSPPGTHSSPPPPLLDSYRMFDDENPNACSVM
ncbi:hypothetical protein GUJ93_ZPchr0013g35549 [Zizania palustris]|uniref:HMA domain-containing protein n=1 Tax=Zizania palustris TaxID=103762 RepID=A0A8J5WXJ2_ZIZPA|nr:hypothetical protein GUJ93_ZPchr0013g35549 [Zizania palustris]